MTEVKKYIKKNRVVIIVNIVLLVLYLIVTSIADNLTGSLYSQQEAMRWENDEVTNNTKKDSDMEDSDDKSSVLKKLVGEKKMPYAQVSAFISPAHGMMLDDVNGVRSTIAEKLNKDSYSDSLTEGRAWIDAYSCETSIDLRKDSNTLTASAVAVGGDFFQFHPMRLLSGNYISDTDLNHDRIVVDENFAWAMFGSNDIVGMQVWLGNNIFYIAGVVEVPKDKLSRIAYGDSNKVYISYSELKKTNDNLPITCYEAVLPNPISNYAYYALREAYGLIEETDDESMSKEKNPLSFDDVEVRENTKRYNSMELLSNVKNWKLRTMHTAAVGYPYWENVARVQEDTQMKLLITRYLLLVFPLISLLWMIYGMWEKKTWTIMGLLLQEIDKERERRNWKAYEKKLAEKEADSEETDDVSDGEEDDAPFYSEEGDDTADSEEYDDDSYSEEYENDMKVVDEESDYIEVAGIADESEYEENDGNEDDEVKLVSVLEGDFFA